MSKRPWLDRSTPRAQDQELLGAITATIGLVTIAILAIGTIALRTLY
jgi:hypothetical protein